MKNALIAAIALFAFPVVSQAETPASNPPTYNDLAVSYSKASLTGLSGGSGYEVSGSYALPDNFYVTGSYGHNSFDDTSIAGVFTHGYTIGGGYHLALYRGSFPADLVLRAGLASDSIKELSSEDTKNGYDVGVGIRFMMVPGIELYGFTDYNNVGLIGHYKASGEVVGTGGVNVDVTKSLALGVEYRSSNRLGGRDWLFTAKWHF